MKYAIVGSGKIGTALARVFARWFLQAIALVYGHDAEAVDGPTPAASIDRP
jgi:predicted dinucleotide-binding enzyme